MRANSRANFRIVVDTNILFSAIRYRGEVFKLLNEAEKAGCTVIIPEYVYEELRMVFERNEVDFGLVTDFLATYEYIVLVEKELQTDLDLIQLAKEKVSDRKDRPIFIYTLLLHEEDPSTVLVTGDKELRKALNSTKEGLSLTIREALERL